MLFQVNKIANAYHIFVQMSFNVNLIFENVRIRERKIEKTCKIKLIKKPDFS